MQSWYKMLPLLAKALGTTIENLVYGTDDIEEIKRLSKIYKWN